jgi:gluconolactonase
MKSLRTLPVLASLAALPLMLIAQPAPPAPAAAASAADSNVAPAVTPADFTASGIGMGPTVAADAVVNKVQGGFRFTEGNTVDAKTGDVYFVDQDNNRIHKWSAADGKVSLFLEPTNYSNGMYFDGKGNLIACADQKNELWSIAPDGTHTVLITSAGYEGKPLDGPNDVWVRPDGGLYITDPIYRRSWWDPAVTRPSQSIRSVYYLGSDRKELKRVAADFQMPNGIIGTPDGKTLYVADMNARKTYGFDIQPDGSLTNRRLVANYGSDGMTLDNQGNLYFSTGLGGGFGGGRGGRGGAPGAGGPGAGGPPGGSPGGQPPAGFGPGAQPPGGAAPAGPRAGAPGAAASGGGAGAPGAGGPPAGFAGAVPPTAGGAPGAGGPPAGFAGGRGGGRGPATPGSSGVAIVDTKTGKLVGFITVPEQPANMAFGGKNHDILVVSARTSLYTIQTKVKGANPAK